MCVFGWGNPACGMALRASRTDYFAASQLGMVLRTSWKVDVQMLLRSGPSDLPVLFTYFPRFPWDPGSNACFCCYFAYSCAHAGSNCVSHPFHHVTMFKLMLVSYFSSFPSDPALNACCFHYFAYSFAHVCSSSFSHPFHHVSMCTLVGCLLKCLVLVFLCLFICSCLLFACFSHSFDQVILCKHMIFTYLSRVPRDPRSHASSSY